MDRTPIIRKDEDFEVYNEIIGLQHDLLVDPSESRDDQWLMLEKTSWESRDSFEPVK
jgi:hypothetical protein